MCSADLICGDAIERGPPAVRRAVNNGKATVPNRVDLLPLLVFTISICLCFVIVPFIKDHNRHLRLPIVFVTQPKPSSRNWLSLLVAANQWFTGSPFAPFALANLPSEVARCNAHRFTLSLRLRTQSIPTNSLQSRMQHAVHQCTQSCTLP